MTEKRFKYTFEGIEDTLESDEEYKYTPCNKDGFQDLCEMLNELNNENKQLKSINQDHKDHLADFYADYDRLEKENEQLKADNNRLVNETARIVAEHQRKVLDLIDKRIDKCEPIDYARNIEGDVPVFDCETATEIRVLNELKKELLE